MMNHWVNGSPDPVQVCSIHVFSLPSGGDAEVGGVGAENDVWRF